VLEKLDGSLVSPVLLNDKISYTTMLGITPHSEKIHNFIWNNKTVDYDRFCKHCLSLGLSPLFEYMSPKEIIVIRYELESLVLLSIRNTHTGKYMAFEQVTSLANEFGIPVVKAWTDAPRDGNVLVEQIKSKENVEGYVVCFDDGDFYKCKTEWYIRHHGINTRKLKETQLWNAILSDEIDDLISMITFDEVVREVLQKYRDAVQSGLVEKILFLQSGQEPTDDFTRVLKSHLNESDLTDDTNCRKAVHEIIKTEYVAHKGKFRMEREAIYKSLKVDVHNLLLPYGFNEKGLLEKAPMRQQPKETPVVLFKK
jgi:T4 RnlA family RNA ligase